MAYREDPHLEFFQILDNKDLEVLVRLFLKDWNNDLKYKLPYQNYFKKNEKVNHKKYWKYIAEEYQLYGGNSFANFLRGEGVPYKEILTDVIDKLDIKPKEYSVEEMEKALIATTIEKSIEKMSKEEKKEFIKSLNLKTTDLSTPAMITALQIAIKQGGFTPYKLAVIVANSIAKKFLRQGLSFAANQTLTKSLSIFAGPIGWAINGLWTAIEIAGPAYRITIPATIYIASLKQSKAKENLFTQFTCPNCNRIITTHKCEYCGEKIA